MHSPVLGLCSFLHSRRNDSADLSVVIAVTVCRIGLSLIEVTGRFQLSLLTLCWASRAAVCQIAL
jgi:hypothetical protein